MCEIFNCNIEIAKSCGKKREIFRGKKATISLCMSYTSIQFYFIQVIIHQFSAQFNKLLALMHSNMQLIKVNVTGEYIHRDLK